MKSPVRALLAATLGLVVGVPLVAGLAGYLIAGQPKISEAERIGSLGQISQVTPAPLRSRRPNENSPLPPMLAREVVELAFTLPSSKCRRRFLCQHRLHWTRKLLACHQSMLWSKMPLCTNLRKESQKESIDMRMTRKQLKKLQCMQLGFLYDNRCLFLPFLKICLYL